VARLNCRFTEWKISAQFDEEMKNPGLDTQLAMSCVTSVPVDPSFPEEKNEEKIKFYQKWFLKYEFFWHSELTPDLVRNVFCAILLFRPFLCSTFPHFLSICAVRVPFRSMRLHWHKRKRAIQRQMARLSRCQLSFQTCNVV
jgi:hypothetical protein